MGLGCGLSFLAMCCFANGKMFEVLCLRLCFLSALRTLHSSQMFPLSHSLREKEKLSPNKNTSNRSVRRKDTLTIQTGRKKIFPTGCLDVSVKAKRKQSALPAKSFAREINVIPYVPLDIQSIRLCCWAAPLLLPVQQLPGLSCLVGITHPTQGETRCCDGFTKSRKGRRAV